MFSITARYDATCSVCGEKTKAGLDQISPVKDNRIIRYGVRRMRKRSRWGHTSCVERALAEIGIDPAMEPVGAVEQIEEPIEVGAHVEDQQPTKEPTVEANGTDALGLLKTAFTKLIDGQLEGRSFADLVSKDDMAELFEDVVRQHQLDAAIATVKEEVSRPVVHEIHLPGVPEAKRFEGEVYHDCFEDVLMLAQARLPIYLPGPSGCGKTHIANQVADALDLPFAHISCSGGMSESHLLGRLIPRGANGSFEYMETSFVQMYENGGVFCLDEVDAADPNVLIVVNAATSNGCLSIPARVEKPVAERHPDFVLIAAANTFGRGADRQYVGRNELDAATLDRFRMGTVPVGYCEAIEKALCPDQELFQLAMGWRKRIEDAGIRRICSTRFLKDAYRMRQMGWSIDRIKEAFFAGWSADERARVDS